MLARTGYDGQEIQESLTQGDFRLELVLIEKPRVGNPGSPHVIGQQTADIHAASAFVETQVDFHLDHAPSQYSTIELGFKVSAKDRAASLASEEALSRWTSYRSGSLPERSRQGGLDAYVQKSCNVDGTCGSASRRNGPGAALPVHFSSIVFTSISVESRKLPEKRERPDPDWSADLRLHEELG